MQKTVLKNKLRIITHSIPSTKTITLLVLIGLGSKYEEKKVNGISHLLEHMFFKGTKKRPNTLSISKELDRVGGVYNAFTGKEFMGYWVKVDSKHFDFSCDILSDMILNSVFSSKEMEKEKKVVFEEINMMKDNPQGFILDLWEKLLYGNQPAGWLISGEKENVASITRKDILDYFSSYFSAENVVISVAGNLDDKKIIPKIETFFKNFQEKISPTKRATIEKQIIPQVSVDFKKTGQVHMCLGVRTFDIFDSRKAVLSVIAGILGGMMSSRLFIKIREKKSLAYYVRTLSEHYSDTGYLVTHAGINSDKVIEAIKIILKEYKDLKTKKVSDQELSKIKENIKGRIYLSLEASDAWAAYFGTQELLKKEILSPEEKCALIDKVTASDILNVSKEIFQDNRLNLALIGPFKDKKDKEKFQKLLKI